MASIPLLRLSLHLTPKTLTTKPYSHTHVTSPSLHLHHPLKSSSLKQPPSKSNLTGKFKPIHSSYKPPTPAVDRIISSAAYLLPFFNGLHYGRHLFAQFPILASVFQPVFPLLSLYRSMPYGTFIAFFALYLGVVRNPSFSRYVRFNSMQALVLDVLLALPMLLERIFSPGTSGVGFRVMVAGHNFVFLFVVLCFLYGLGSSVLGRTAYLPFVADAAGRQLGGD